MPVAPHPLLLTPQTFPKVWGEERWLLADLDATSASGAGGGAVRSVIARGPLAGLDLRAADQELALGLVPGAPRGTRYPLLLKALTAREHLSLQVHPSPGYAALAPGMLVKHESWIVTAAAPGAELFLGLTPGTAPHQFTMAARSGPAALRPLLRRVQPELGAGYTLPSGLVHALGAGIEVIEVQTASDTTFRLDDWADLYDRPTRPMHVDLAIAAAQFDLQAVTTPPGSAEPAVTPQYRVRRVELSPGDVHHIEAGDAVHMMNGSAQWTRAMPLTLL
jgi:mannose-6-phosphate isomerase